MESKVKDFFKCKRIESPELIRDHQKEVWAD